MKQPFISLFLALVACSLALTISNDIADMALRRRCAPRQVCQHGPTSRGCWGQYSIDTNYYDVIPHTGVTREYWLSVVSVDCAPDGYQRKCMTFNGTLPGPPIIADWGDDLVVHVTNNMADNGTSVHWHGMRQLNSVEYDGVPGVTQCPIAPGQTLTYKFHVSQYGSTWYHSHLSLQYTEGLLGPLILNGPATANYDEDLGTVFLQDWSHIESFTRWVVARHGLPPPLESGLINGMNTFDCTGSSDPKCVGEGKKFQFVFQAGKKYRMRIINVAIEGHFRFSIDGHNLTIIANDLVPIVPFTTDSLLVAIGQRYDVIVEANAALGNYWMRSGWQNDCVPNKNAANMTAIIRYNASSTDEPTTTSNANATSNCGDEPVESLVPHVALDVTNAPVITLENLGSVNSTTYFFHWTINSSSLLLNWTNPTLQQIFNNASIFPTEYNVVAADPVSSGPEWAVLVIQDTTGLPVSHPIHLHGHDFWILAQSTGTFNGTSASFQTKNPPRRDVAILPQGGYLAIAFKLDNPGVWLAHCHIAWHASEGLSLEFVEMQNKIAGTMVDTAEFEQHCKAWADFKQVFAQEDSGI